MKKIETFEDISDIEEKLNTDISSGLSRKAARERAFEEGRADTSFYVRKKRNFFSCFFGVVKMLPAAILTLVAVAAFFMGRSQLAIAVLSTFISGSIVSGMLYLSAQRSSERVEVYSNPTSRVLRGGKEYITDCRNIVVGDVVILRAGDYVPCDLIVVESESLVVSRIVFNKEIGYKTNEIGDVFDTGEKLIAGSFVDSGYAKAVAYAVGDDTLMSEHVRSGDLAKKNSDPLVIKRTYKYLSGLVFILSILALLLAIVGMFTSKNTGILENFLMYLSLILSMTLVSSPIAGRILLSSMIKRTARNSGANYAVIKNNSAIDVLPNVTDVVICGMSGITDGEKYLSTALLSGKVVKNAREMSPEEFIFECIYSSSKAKKEDHDSAYEIDDGTIALERAVRRVRFDVEAANVRIKSLYYGALMEGYPVACVETSDLSYRVYVGDDLSVLEICNFVRCKNKLPAIDDDYRKIMEAYIDGAGARGESVYAVVSEIDGEIILEGLVGLVEGVCESIFEIRKTLADRGAKISVMLTENSEYNRFYLNKAGFSNDKIFVSSNEPLTISNDVCAYMGYTPMQYAQAVSNMKNAGRTVAVVGVSDEYCGVYDKADVLVCYDNINYGSPDFFDSEFEASVLDGCDFSKRCSQKTRTRADVLIDRGSIENGGLRGFVEAVRCAEGFSFNYIQMMLLFIAVEAVLVFMTFVSFVSGIPMISYPAILLLVVALVFFSVAAFSTFKQRVSIPKEKMSMAYFTRQIVRKIVPTITASVICFGVAVYLYTSGYIMDTAAIPLSTTIGVILTYVLSFGGSMRACIGKKIDMSDIKGFSEKDKHKSGLLNIAAMTLVLTSVVRMILTALLIPSMAIEYGYVGICAETFILLGVYFISFALCAMIIKLVRAIKKHK